MPTVAGPDFIALQVRDIERAAQFYEHELGLTRAPGPRHAVVFATQPIAFALRDPLPETDLDSGQPGLGVALWLRADDAQALHDQLAQHDVTILTEPVDGPFGRTGPVTQIAWPCAVMSYICGAPPGKESSVARRPACHATRLALAVPRPDIRWMT